MIRRHTLSSIVRIPDDLRRDALRCKHQHFRQILLDKPIMTLARQIPYPVDRQMHSLIMLGDGFLEPHEDDLEGEQDTAYCYPIHFPRGARLFQEYQQVELAKNTLYSFNHAVSHGLYVPDTAKTFSLFLCVGILTTKEYAWRKKRGLLLL